MWWWHEDEQIQVLIFKPNHTMKTITLSPIEFYVFRDIANKLCEPFVIDPYKGNKHVTIVVSLLFCDAHGY